MTSTSTSINDAKCVEESESEIKKAFFRLHDAITQADKAAALVVEKFSSVCIPETPESHKVDATPAPLHSQMVYDLENLEIKVRSISRSLNDLTERAEI